MGPLEAFSWPFRLKAFSLVFFHFGLKLRAFRMLKGQLIFQHVVIYLSSLQVRQEQLPYFTTVFGLQGQGLFFRQITSVLTV